MRRKAQPQTCARLYRDLCPASIGKDESGMLRLLADDSVLVHMTGMRHSGRDYVDACSTAR